MNIHDNSKGSCLLDSYNPPAPTFEIAKDGGSIKCLCCGRTSHNPRDVSERYCGWCHAWHVFHHPAWEESDEL